MKKRVIAFLVVLLIMMSISVTAFAAPTDGATLRHSVAMIEVGVQYSTGTWNPAEWEPWCRGSGFFIGKEGEDPQYLITNRHVVEDYIKLEKGESLYGTDKNGNVVAIARAQVRVFFDYNTQDYVEAYLVEAGDTDSRDFAILRLAEPTSKRSALPISIPTQEMSDPNKKVYSVGFPGIATSEDFRPTSLFGEQDASIDVGIINKLFVQTGTGVPTIQFSATIHHGNSGGPLVYENGAAIGITTWGLEDSQASTTLYYAVSMELVKPYLDRNNVPYTLLDGNETAESKTEADSTEKTSEEGPANIPVAKKDLTWLIYAILGAAILGVAALLFVILRKPRHNFTNSTVTTNGTVVRKPPEPATKASRVLVGVEGPLKGEIFPLEIGKKLCIGRDKSSCKVYFKDGTPGVSNRHCELRFDGKVVTITDLGSSYGTMIDGNKLPANKPQTLHRGHPIDIGTAKNRFVLK